MHSEPLPAVRLLPQLTPSGAGEAVFNLACTDDLLSIIPVPEGATEAVMAKVICKSLDLLNTEGREITGVSFDTPKTKVYIPSG